MLSDFHLHSLFSGDSESNLDDIINTAIAKGMSNLCITDHQDFDMKGFDLDVAKYYCILCQFQKAYSDRIQLHIGVEIGIEPYLVERLNNFIIATPFDFVIGSSHLINSVDPYYPEYWIGRNEHDVYLEYFESIVSNIKVFNNYDVYGHLDYIARYGPNKEYCYSDYFDIIDEILKSLINLGKGIELNTGGLSRGLDSNPCPDIIKRYKELGGEIITIGSDAHTPDKIGFGFDWGEQVLKDAGFKYYTIFKERSPEFIAL